MNNQLHLFVGGYAAADQASIHRFSFDEATGVLALHNTFQGITNPSFLALHPHQRCMYAVSETSVANDGIAGGVWALRWDTVPQTLEPLNRQPSGGDWPCHLALDRTGHWLLVSNYGTGSVGVLPIRDGGSLGEITDLVQHYGRSINRERQTEPHAHSTTFAPDNRFVIVADLGIDQLVVYAFDNQKGHLRPHTTMHTQPGVGPRHLAFHPNGERVYVANELDSTVCVYDYDATRGLLHARQCLTTIPAGTVENTVADIHITPLGERVYVSNRGHDSLVVFDIGADGLLTQVAIIPCGGNGPRNFALAPSGRWLVVANQQSDEVVVLPMLHGADALGAPVTSVAVKQPSFVGIV